MTEVKKASTTKVSGGNDAGKSAPNQGLPGLEQPGQGLPGAQPGVDNTLPGDQPTPDQGLPGTQPGIDNTLPPGVDNALPGDQPYPDQGLPGSQPGVGNELPGYQPVPDQGLPGSQPGIDNTLPPGVDNELPGDQPRPDQGLPGSQPEVDNELPPGVDNELPGDQPEIDNELPPVSADDLMDIIASAEKLEVVYCDGEGPLGITALKVTKTDFKMTANGVKLERQEVLIYGPGREQRAYELDGYALIADGEQVAYSERPEPLTIGNGMTVNVADDIVFPVKERDDRS